MEQFTKRELICDHCKLPLSIPPVTLSKTGDTFCGRCKNDPESVVLNVFQQLAFQQKFLFPCCNSVNGCTVKDKFGTIAKHEIKCDKKRIPCPVKDCGVVCVANNIEHHCRKDHSNFILDNIDSISFSLSDLSESKNAKLYFGDRLSLVVIYKIEDKHLKICARNLTGNKYYLKYNFSIHSKDLKRSLKYPEEPFSSSKYLAVTQNDLIYILNKDKSFIVSINLQKAQYNEGFLCFGCDNYIKSSGTRICNLDWHRLCSKCYEEIKFCSSCATKNLQKNLFLCPISCIQNCDIRKRLPDILTHFKDFHSNVLHTDSLSSTIFYSENVVAAISFLRVHDNCFKCIRKIEKGSMYVKVMLIGLEFDKYRFTLSICSGHKSISVSYPVYPLSHDTTDMNYHQDSLKIDAKLITSIIRNSKLNLQIVVDKI